MPPAASAPTSSHGPMIQPRSVTQCSTSSACISTWWATSCAIFDQEPAVHVDGPLGPSRRARRVHDHHRGLRIERLGRKRRPSRCHLIIPIEMPGVERLPCLAVPIGRR